MTTRATTQLRKQLGTGPVVAAGCFDPLSARLAELAGFTALHLTGFGVEISQLGAPDLGLMTLSELAAHAARITATVSVPILADVDTGFGGVLNVNRTIREMERAGVAGVHIEDQKTPKRCPLLAGRQVVDRKTAVERVAAACDARSDPDFIVVARTDADVVSFDEVVERCNLYLRAGADMVMPMLMDLVFDAGPFATLPSDEQVAAMTRLCERIEGPVMGMGGPPPKGYTAQDMGRIGFAFWMFASAALGAAANAMADMYSAILADGTDRPFVESHPGRYHGGTELMRAVHLDRYERLERGR